MLKNIFSYLKDTRKAQRGYTLLEYCAGAAIIAGIVWVALDALGANLSGLLEGIGQWAVRRTNNIAE